MTIEKEFFEAFGIEPKCLNEEYSGCKYSNDDNRKCCKQYKDKTCNYSYFWIYPPVTPEIVLGLEDVILDKYVDSLLLTKIKDRTFEYRNGYSKCWNNIVQADTRKDALLKLCIQLKDEMQEGVRGLFINNKQNGVINK